MSDTHFTGASGEKLPPDQREVLGSGVSPHRATCSISGGLRI